MAPPAASRRERAPMREVELRSRGRIVLGFVFGVLGLLFLATAIPRDTPGRGMLVPVAFAVGLWRWQRSRGFLAVRITPTHVALRYFVGERRIARDDIVSVKLRVDMADVSDSFLADLKDHFEDSGYTVARRQKLREDRLDAATKYRAWVTTSDASEYRSVRFDDVQRFNALQRALQFAFEGSGGAAPTR